MIHWKSKIAISLFLKEYEQIFVFIWKLRKNKNIGAKFAFLFFHQMIALQKLWKMLFANETLFLFDPFKLTLWLF